MLQVQPFRNEVIEALTKREAKGHREGYAEGFAKGVIFQGVKTIRNLRGLNIPFEEALEACEIDEKYLPEVMKFFPEEKKAQ